MKTKKLLSLLLTLTLILTLLPVTATAATHTWSGSDLTVGDGDIVNVISGTGSGTLTIPNTVNALTINGGGQSINGGGQSITGSITISPSRSSPLTLTISDLTLKSQISVPAGDATLNLDNVTINANDASGAIYKSSGNGSLTLNITNTVTLNGFDGYALHDVSNAGLVIGGTGTLYAHGGNNPSGDGSEGGRGGSGLSGVFIINASGGTYAQGGGQPLVHTTNKDFSLFSGVRMDGKTITRDTDYKAENGSTVVTVFAEFLDTLPVGKHKLSVLFKDGVTVNAEFEILEVPEPDPWVNPFEDVFENDWFYGDVEYVYTKILMRGTNIAPMLFSPHTPLTRGMIVTILWRLEGSPVIGRDSPDNPFSDVPSGGTYYADAVHWAAAEGIVTGCDGKFMPKADVTRQDLAVILMRYIEYSGIAYIVTEEYRFFADEDEIAPYAKSAVQTLNKLDIIRGKAGNIIDPLSNAPRAEAAAMLHRFIGK